MNSREKMRLYFFIELFVWLLIIIVGVSVFRYNNIKKQKEFKSYQLFMQDVDGLIVGSQVRMMGVPIGYIKTIKIVQDHVYVKFVIDNPEVQLPKGVIATVEFNGMAGSKSLELYPPDEVSKASEDLIAIKPTSRLGAALGLLDDMFDKLGSIMVRCQIFSEQLVELVPPNNNDGVVSEDPVKEVSNSVNFVGKLVESFDKSRIRLKDRIRGLFNE